MNVSEQMIAEIVRQVLAEKGCAPAADDGIVKQVAPSGVIGIKTANVKMEPFEGRRDVVLKDLTTLEEAPRMGIGIMELTGKPFEWTLTYDEFDIVLEGHLEIETDGTIVKAGPGEVIYIPKGTHIHFQTPDYVRYLYTVYPANWADGTN